MRKRPRFRIIPEVHLILRNRGRLLMLRRCRTGYMDGYWSLVAGHVDGDETFAAAMIREAREEAGIALTPDALTLVHSMHRKADEERLSLFFEATAWQGDLTNSEPHKCDALDWIEPENLPHTTVPYIRAALDAVTGCARYSEFGWE